MNFHNVFDGILGSEYLAKTGGVLNYKNETFTIEETLANTESICQANHFTSLYTFKPISNSDIAAAIASVLDAVDVPLPLFSKAEVSS